MRRRTLFDSEQTGRTPMRFTEYISQSEEHILPRRLIKTYTFFLENTMRKELLLGITLALSSTVAFAASFNDYDSNGDGKLTTDEFYGSVSDMGKYSDWDTSGDGLIDENEWNTLGWDYDYDTWDANSDGWLNSGEFYDGIYGTYDENEDGHWNNNEWDDAGDAGMFDV